MRVSFKSDFGWAVSRTKARTRKREGEAEAAEEESRLGGQKAGGRKTGRQAERQQRQVGLIQKAFFYLISGSAGRARDGKY